MLTRHLLLITLAIPALLWGRVKTGLDVLVEQDFAPLAGKRVGVIANQNSMTWDHRNIVAVMVKSSRVKLTAIFSPEHGFSGTNPAGAIIESGKDSVSGVPVYSLYNRGSNRPTPEMLAGVDVLVYDLPDVGARFWTYTTTLGYVMEVAAPLKIPIYVLDRPNPINGVTVEGPMLDQKYKSMIGYGSRPVRHGMTSGELAQLFNAENKIGAALTVIPMKDWNRGDWFDSTNLLWVNPSPNLRSLTAVTLYPGLCLLEAGRNWSVGRGTPAPFEQVGADFLKGGEFAAYLNQRQIPGVRAYPTSFVPEESNFKGVRIEGVRFVITNRELFDSTRLGLEVAAAVQKLYPGKLDIAACVKLIGSTEVVRQLQAGEDPRNIEQNLVDSVAAFVKMREKYLLYR